jgi:transcriptional regulator with XRE-family HTH domain
MENKCFKEIGLAIKAERKKAGLTREQLAERIHISTRYLISIENDGQAPSFDILYMLIRTFNISMDQYIFDETKESISTVRRNINYMLESLSEKELLIIENTIRGIQLSKM